MNVSLVLHRLVKQHTEKFEDIRLDDFEFLLTKICEHQLKGSKGSRVLITFDDGHKSDIELALPAIQKFQLNAQFYIVPAWIGKPGFCSWNDIRDLSAAGMKIGSHSMTHPRLTQISKAGLQREILDSKKMISDKLGKDIETFAIPYGDKNKKVIAYILESGYQYCCISDHGTHQTGDRIIPRNSINARTQLKKYSEIINPTFKTRLFWHSEDYGKKLLKFLPDNLYRKIRNFAGGFRG